MEISHKATKPRRCPELGFFVPLCLGVSLFLVSGCKQEKGNPYPQDRLTVEYSIDHETLLVGDPAVLSVTALYPTNGTLTLPEIGREKDVVLLKRDWQDIPREDGLKQSETSYSITSFRLGEHVVSTGTITCAVGGETFSTNFPNVVLHVQSSLADDASPELADIKPPQKLPARIPPAFWIALAVAALAFLIGLITSKLWKNRETFVAKEPPVPPHITALKALEALQAKGMLEKDECNPFYTELSIILRTYLEGRFSLNAPDETTEEIVEEMSRSPELNGSQRNILQDFMRQADMVKFAKGHPDRSTMESAFDTTKQFVEETKLTTDELATKEHLENKE